MNQKQRNILKGAMVAVIMTLAFPPFANQFANGIVYWKGFGFILTGPESGSASAVIYLPTLVTEWVAIAIVCGILWALSSDQ